MQKHYAALFEDAPQLTLGRRQHGVRRRSATIRTPSTALKEMGYSRPAEVLAIIRGWHHGRYPSVRSPRARERLTEVQPLLVAALADTADPDRALASFDRFIAELPAGVQLFSLLRANPGLLRLLADIMGTAPRLARILSRRRRLLDAVLDPRTLGMLPTAAELDRLIDAEMGVGENDMQHVLDRARVIGSEQQFLIGVRVLSGAIKANQAGGAYALLAERLIDALRRAVERELVRTHGKVPGGGAAVLAMGKLGGREMTATSDIDLILIYDFDDAATQSDGGAPAGPDTVLCAADATADQRAVLGDGRGLALRGRHAAAPLRPAGPGRHAAEDLRRLSDKRGLDVGAHGVDARARHLRAAAAARARRGGGARFARVAARSGEDRRRRPRHA